MPELPRLLHPLAPDVRCLACGAGLTFIRVRIFGDLYQCASGGPCKRQVMHYRHKETQTCGYAPVYSSGVFGVWTWTACSDKPRAEGE